VVSSTPRPQFTPGKNPVPILQEAEVDCGVEGKVVPLQARRYPEGFRKFRSPDFMITAQDGGKVVSLTHRPLLPPGNTPGTHFC